MTTYCIYVVTPAGNPHAQAFDEHALCLHHAFGELGLDAPVVRHASALRGTPVVLGAHLLAALPEAVLPESAVIFNLEQLSHETTLVDETYMALLRSHTVWDFSERNRLALAELGVTAVRLCPIGFTPGSATMGLAPADPDIDVLFYGSLNARRERVLLELEQHGARVGFLFGAYGEERDAYILRSKIVLNVHFYESKIFEIIRVAHLLANRRFVVSERGTDLELEGPFVEGVAFADYERLVDTCLHYLEHPDERARIAARGHEIFSARSQARYVEAALRGPS